MVSVAISPDIRDDSSVLSGKKLSGEYVVFWEVGIYRCAVCSRFHGGVVVEGFVPVEVLEGRNMAVCEEEVAFSFVVSSEESGWL